MSGVFGRINDISGQGAIKNARVALAVGNDQTVVAGVAGKKYQIVAVEVSTDAATTLQVHFGALASIATKHIAGGYLPANGGLVKVTGAFGKLGATAEAINASVSAAANVIVSVDYIEVTV